MRDIAPYGDYVQRIGAILISDDRENTDNRFGL